MDGKQRALVHFASAVVGPSDPGLVWPDGQVFVEKTEEEALDAAVQHYLAHEGPWKAWVQEKLENFAPGEILDP